MIGHMWYSKESPMCKENQVSKKLVEGNQYTWNDGESYKFDVGIKVHVTINFCKLP
jgi:hypothetical protein